MSLALTLLDGVRWYGRPVAGDRPQALLAALTAADGRAVSNERLVEAVWGEDVPANTGKALQVLVSRTRALCGPHVVVHEGRAYRLGVSPDQVDVLRLDELTGRARRALAAEDAAAARAAALEAIALTRTLTVPGDDDGPLAELRRVAEGRTTELTGLLGRALSGTGDHAAALPRLEEAFDRNPSDEAVLASLLRSEAIVRGTAPALDRYETYRSELRDRLGTDPGEDLQRVHRHLLALDSPVREGLRYDTSSLLGREDDIRRLRALVNTARVVSIVGPGGLGKTRLAHVLGRAAGQPVVHFVELVGVTVPEDVVGEVGSALGVRDSVSGRRTLTPEQRSDVRARIAQHLASAASLLILDNCEHVVEAVADLVAFLVATTQDLRVVTTTRAPLAIAAEHVYPLGELGTPDAVELFRQRAVAARPGVRLPHDAVTDIVVRLDGLPLAIELAAAKVRVMSVDDIRRRLENRFALLRGGARGTPDRHQTLIAVIDWSWNLLGEPERRVLRRLSVFHDGFTLDAAEAVLAGDALDAVQSLVDQSLLGVTESGAGVRYRMLETVREFGRMQLVGAGEDEPAHAAQRAWATAYGRDHGERLFGPDQFTAMDAMAAEESNLADVLRQALAAPDPDTVVQLLATLGSFWSIRGDHARVIVLAGAIVDAMAGWHPPARLEDVTRQAMVVALNNLLIAADERTRSIRDLLIRLGDGGAEPRVRAMTRVLLALDPADGAVLQVRLRELADDPDRHVAVVASQWLSHTLENNGDPAGAVEAAEHALGLTEESDGPWTSAILHTQLAQLDMQLGSREAATVHAHAALPVLDRLGATDDLVQLRSLLALCAVADGRLEEAASQLRRIDQRGEPEAMFGGPIMVLTGEAELALARGDHATGLRMYREAVPRMHAVRFPGLEQTGLEPWVLQGESTALTAYALYGHAEDEEAGAELFRTCLDRAPRALDLDHPYLDYPVSGVLLFALGAWGLMRQVMPAEDAVRLLVLAERFAYNRSTPTLAWENVESHADARAPGMITALREEFGDRRGPELLDEARRCVEKIG